MRHAGQRATTSTANSVRPSPTTAAAAILFAAAAWVCGRPDAAANPGPQSIAFTMELRPAGLLGGGFVLPDAEIRPSGAENVAGVVSFAEALLEQHRRRVEV